MRYVFIINPAAGKGKLQEKIFENANAYFKGKNLDFSILYSKARGDAKLLAKTEAEKGDEVTIFACGGEGTSFEVLNGIYGYDNVTMGVVPCGSANDFLRFFSANDSFMNFEEQIEGETVDIDLIKAGEFYCLNGCSVGMDAIVAKNMFIFKKWPLVSGGLAYKLAIVKTFLGKLGVKLGIKVDDKDFGEQDCLFAVIANAPYYGGGFMGAPKAIPNDQKLNFTKVALIGRLAILKFLPLYKKGEQGKLDCCYMSDCDTLEINSETEVPVNLDGEIIFTKSIKFEIVKKGIRLLLPKKAVNKLLIKA